MFPQLSFLKCQGCGCYPCSCSRIEVRERTPLQKWRNERKLAVQKALAGTLLWPSGGGSEATPDQLSPFQERFQGNYQQLFEALRAADVNDWFATALVEVALRAEIDVSGISVTSGARTPAEQERLIAQGDTETSPAMSRHVPCGQGAEAVDLAGQPGVIAQLGRASWGTGIRWGGHWQEPEPWHFYVELTDRPCRG